MSKKCKKCLQEKRIDEFSLDRRMKDHHINTCKECVKAYRKNYLTLNKDKVSSVQREWYTKNKSKCNKNSLSWAKNNPDKMKSAVDRLKDRHRNIIIAHFNTHPCIDCGETNILVLEFDHIRGNKIKEVSQMCGSSVEDIRKEIDKCVVRCRNCHRKKTNLELSLRSSYSSANARLKKQRRNELREYLKSHPCVDCGITDSEVLEFDHVRGEKSFTIMSELMRPKEILFQEIAKCDIRCGNCHKLRTLRTRIY